MGLGACVLVILYAVLVHAPATHYETDYSDGELVVVTMEIDKLVADDDDGITDRIIATGLDSEECEAFVVRLNKQFKAGEKYGAGGSLASCIYAYKEVAPK